MPKKTEDEKTISLQVPFDAWIAVKTSAAKSGLPMKEYLARYLAQAKPYAREGDLATSEAV